MNDSEFIQAIETTAPKAREFFAAIDAWQAGRTSRPPMLIGDQDFSRGLAAIIERRLSSLQNTLFIHRGNLSVPFNAANVTLPLLRVAIASGPADAIAWLERLLQTPVTTGVVVAEIMGVTVDEPQRLGTRVDLIPLSSVSKHTAEEIDEANAGTLGAPGAAQWPTAVGTIEITEYRYLAPRREQAAVFETVNAAQTEINRAIKALTMIGPCTPTIRRMWMELKGEDAAALGTGGGYISPVYDGWVSFAGPRQISNTDANFITRYLTAQISDSFATKISFALSRLHLAQRRLSYDDRAVDCAVCLEILLGDQEPTELTFRIALRAALLVGVSRADREDIRQAVKRLYSLRSKVVHGQIRKPDAQQDQTIRRGIEICGQAIRRYVELGRDANWAAIELGEPLS